MGNLWKIQCGNRSLSSSYYGIIDYFPLTACLKWFLLHILTTQSVLSVPQHLGFNSLFFFFFKLNNKHKVHDEMHLWRTQAAYSHDLFSTHYSKTSAGAFLMHIVSFLPPCARYLFPLQAKQSCKISEQDLCLLPRSPSSHLAYSSSSICMACQWCDQTAVCLQQPTAKMFSHSGQLEASRIRKSRHWKRTCFCTYDVDGKSLGISLGDEMKLVNIALQVLQFSRS